MSSDPNHFALVPGADERLGEVQEILRTDIDRYWSEGLDREHSDLLAGKEPVARSAADKRLAEIDAIRKRDIEEYWRLKLDKEELALLEQKLAAPTSQFQVAGLSDPARKSLSATPEGRDLLKRWDAKGEALFWFKELRTDAEAMIKEAPALGVLFDSLPPPAQTAVFSELASLPGHDGEPASREDLRLLAESDIGDLIDEWGRDAAAHLARVHERAERILKGLTPAVREHLLNWFDHLPTRAARTVVKRLAR